MGAASGLDGGAPPRPLVSSGEPRIGHVPLQPLILLRPHGAPVTRVGDREHLNNDACLTMLDDACANVGHLRHGAW